MGQILGIKLPHNYLVVLKVREIIQKTQTTVLQGDSLLFSTTWLPQNLYFSQLLANWSNVPMTWGELSAVPPRQTGPGDFHLIPQPPPVAPVKEGIATLLNTGFDPLRGYWAEFAGNYNLYFGLFQGDWNSTVGS